MLKALIVTIWWNATVIANSIVTIYAGAGVTMDLLEHLKYSLALIDNVEYKLINDAKELISSDWDTHSTLLIIPGGMDRDYVKAITKNAIERIQNFVKNGGSFLGICGGAYFAASDIAFEIGNEEHEIAELRDLALYPGTAYGSAIRPFSFAFNKHNRAANVKMMVGNGRIASFYFMGGCYFEPKKVIKANWKIIAEYVHSEKAAIIMGRYGKGTVILSGPHIEADTKLMKGLENTYFYKEITKKAIRRTKVFKAIIRALAQ